MPFSYFEGFIISLIVVIVIASILLIISIIYVIIEKDLVLILAFILISVALDAVVFILTYSTLNFILQIHLYSEVILEEVEKGILFLRISSLLIGLSSLKYYRRFFSERKKSYLDNKYFEKFKEFKDLAPVQTFEDFTMNAILQYSFYMINIIFLWVFIIFQMEGLLTWFLNWAVFFITDDWLIILKYSELLKGRILPSHIYRIHLFNLGSFICLIIVFYVYFNVVFAIVSTIVICIYFFLLLISFAKSPSKEKNSVRKSQYPTE